MDIDGLSDAILDELTKYGKTKANDVKQIVDDVTDELLTNVKSDSPKRKGKYSKGWRKKTEFDGVFEKRNRVYNATSYQLTHLIEFGYNKRGGKGRVEGRPHIKPNEEKAIKELTERIERAVQEK